MQFLHCPPLVFTALAWLLSFIGTAIALPLLKRARILDMPGERSNHAAPTPRGGGIAMIFSALLFLAASGMSLWIIAGALLLVGVSFADDRKSVPAAIRFSVQLIAVFCALHAFSGRILPGFIPWQVEYALLALAWLWFINLTNFMDGIDGITSMQMMIMAIGIAFLTLAHPLLPPALAIEAIILAASVLGFYGFNRSPARLFMGDVGSIPLGFLMGYLLIRMAMAGFWPAALILPAYYLSDATFTLLRRLLRGARVWQAHSEHAYQHAVRAGLTHINVVSKISILNAALVLLAMLSATSMMAGMIALIIAYVLTFCLMRHFFHALPAL